MSTEAMMEELWSEIIEDNYLVSSLGKVYSITKDKLMKTRFDKQGYEVLVLHTKNGAVNRSVHRLVAKAFIPNPCNLPMVNHIDGDKTNNMVCNLEWSTSSRNNQHAFDTGLRKSGENHHKAKLSEQDVRDIQVMLSEGMPQRAIAKYFPVGRTTIAKIAKGQIWRHLTEED
jgi:hypothetical protein